MLLLVLIFMIFHIFANSFIEESKIKKISIRFYAKILISPVKFIHAGILISNFCIFLYPLNLNIMESSRKDV